MRLLHFIEQHDRVRFAANGLGEHAAFGRAFVAARRTDELRDLVLFLELGHVDDDHVAVAAVEQVGEGECGFGFADAGRADEEEDADGAAGVAEFRAGCANAFRDFAQRVILADDAFAEPLVELKQEVDFVANHLADGDAGPPADDLADRAAIDDGHHQRVLALKVGKFLAETGQFSAPGLGRVAVGALRFGRRLVNRSHQCALLLQPHLEHVAVRFRSLLSLGEFDEPRVVILPAAPFPRDARNLDVEVLDLADHVFECRRGRALAQLHAGRCRVQQAHGLVGQLALGQVPDAQPHGLDHGLVEDAHLVVLLHRLDDGAHHANGLRLIRLLDPHFLEAALQSRVALEVLLVFVEGGGRDGAEFAAGQGRFQEIRRVVLTGRAAGPDHRVRFIDEQNDRHGGRLHFLNHGLQAVLELALHPGPGLEQSQIERAKFDVAKRLGHVAGDDPHREPFHDCRLADARFTREDRVVLPSPREDVDDLANLGIAAEDAVDLPLLHGQREVVRVLIQARRLGIPRGPRRAIRQGRGLSRNRRGFLGVLVGRATFQNRLQLGV